jgi:leucyl aminopeptidase
VEVFSSFRLNQILICCAVKQGGNLLRIRVDSKLTTSSFDALVVGVFSDGADLGNGLDEATRKLVKQVQENGSVGKLYETESTFVENGPAKRLLVIGLGKEAEFDVMKARRAAAVAGRLLRKKGASRLAYALPSGQLGASAAQAFAEGVTLSIFDSSTYATGENKDEKVLEDVVFLSPNADPAFKDAIERGVVIGEGANFSRWLANEPANNMYPEILADHARQTAEQYGLEFDALDAARLQAGGFKAIMAVGQGSIHDPRMIVLKYNGAGEGQPYFGIVGKGITFDSGGISIKPADNMGDMKMDMSGGAWTIGIMRIIAQLKPKINVLGIVPAAENMPSGTSYRPGDVIGSLEGKNIEVLNTDAEGRLVLADGLAYARKLGATKLLDMATLTGAIVVALGSAAAGVFTNNQKFADQFLKNAEVAGERVWQMPVFPEYTEQIRSSIGDIVNTGGRGAGASTAAAFLKEFVGDADWIHLDIAGVAYTDAEKPYTTKGSTGLLIRSVVDFVLANVAQ